MIVTLTPNPSLDLTLEVDRLVLGDVNRAEKVAVDPGGKGINVSRALHGWGVDTRAIAPIGGPSGTEFLQLLDQEGVDFGGIKVEGAVRINVTVNSEGVVTKINSAGRGLSPDDMDRLAEVVLREAIGADWLALCGSLTPGSPADFYAGIIAAADIPVAVDTSGAPLVEAVRAGARLCKPNVHELATAVGASLDTLGDVIGAAHTIRRWGCEAVVVSLGADGAVLVDGAGVTHAYVAEPIEVASSVGAGDALLAALLAAEKLDRRALAAGVAAGTAACRLPGTTMPTPGQVEVESVEVVDDPDPATRLGEPGVAA